MMDVFNSGDYEHTVVGRTQFTDKLWIGFSDKKDYDLEQDGAADVLIEFEKDEHARDFINLLQKELGDDE